MCGRFSLGKDVDEIIDELGFDDTAGMEDYLPNFNVAPTVVTPVLVHEKRQRVLSMRWGLIPSWARDSKAGARLINARCETLTGKPSFRSLVGRRHCVAIAEGYYEWKRYGRSKTPYFIRPSSRRLLFMAGLWDLWDGPDQERPVQSFTIITRPPLDEFAAIHDRMPAVLSPERAARWLDTASFSRDDCTRFLQAEDTMALEAYPVSTLVNSVRNNSPACTEPVGPVRN